MKNEKNERIRIKFESFNHSLLNDACKLVIDNIKAEREAKFVGPVPLPTQYRRYCVLRSPHVNKDSREHFELRIHKRLLDVYLNPSEAKNILVRIPIPAGVTTTIR